MDLHHRQLRSQGGTHTVANLLYVHHLCHVSSPHSIHQNPERSERLGHIVPYGVDPATVPVVAARDLQELRA